MKAGVEISLGRSDLQNLKIEENTAGGKNKVHSPVEDSPENIQYISLAGFIALFIGARRGGWLASLVNIPLRLDPLTVLSNFLASRTLLSGSIIALLVVMLTLILGRVWCGWLCPLGTVLDVYSPKKATKGVAREKFPWRGVKYGLLLVTLVAALFGNLTLLILDPLTIFIKDSNSQHMAGFGSNCNGR